MNDPRVPESILRPAHKQIAHFVTTTGNSYNVDLSNPDFGEAFMYYLFFSFHPAIGTVLGVELDDESKFYNAYYWFQRFVRLYEDNHGYDAGLDQQALRLLENATCGIDFEIIEMLDKKAGK